MRRRDALAGFAGVYAFRARGRIDEGVSDVYDVNVANTILFTVRDTGA